MNATRRFCGMVRRALHRRAGRRAAFSRRRFREGAAGGIFAADGEAALAALRMLFDWLVTGHVLDVNPAHPVRGPKYVVKKGKTPVLTADEARELLDCIEVVRTTAREDGTRTRSRTWSVCAIAR
jgi:site-specific recombinase XerC